MNCIDAILSRRSIRRYTDQHVSEEMVDTMLKSAMYAPSAVNKQPWHFIVVRDKKKFEDIIDVHPNSKMLMDADMAIVVCIDTVQQHDDGYGIQDCSAATQNILLTAHELGLGAVWLGIFPREKRMEAVKRIFQLPSHIQPFAMISIGFPDETKTAFNRFDKTKIHYESWNE